MTAVQDIQKVVCPQCYAVLDVGDNFCRHCGAPMRNSAAASPVPARVVPARPGERSKWSENRWVVLALLLLVLGPVALPLLWRSRQFSPVWKVILTTLSLGMTVWILWWIWHDLQKTLEPLKELRQIRGL